MSIFDLSKLAPKSPTHSITFGRRIADTTTYLLKDVGCAEIQKLLSDYNESSGNFGIEFYKSNGNYTSYFFQEATIKPITLFPNTFRPMIDMGDLNNISCFTLTSNKSSCFPFLMQSANEFVWDMVKKYTSKYSEKLFIQLILHKQPEKWRGEYKRLYLDYLNGIDIPTKNKLIRTAQYKILEFLIKVDQHNFNPDVAYAEDKFEQDGFKCEIRFIIHGGDEKNRGKIAEKVKLAFSILNYANTWALSEMPLKKMFMENLILRRFSIVERE